MHTLLDVPVSFSIKGYRVLNKLGEGGMGSVWRAVQESTSREVALKILNLTIMESRKKLLRFEREVELAASLKHPNIAHIYDSGLDEGRYYYAMELISGVHLDDYVKTKSLTQKETLILFCKICQAVTYAHQRGIIHRDIKPSNIMVDLEGEPHLLDFGLAKNILDISNPVSVSFDGGLLGTLYYMSPEQVRGDLEHLDTRSDIYSLGVVLYKLLLGVLPYGQDLSHPDLIYSLINRDPIWHLAGTRRLNKDLEAILRKMLEKHPSHRYQSVFEISSDIHCWINHEPVKARQYNIWVLLIKYLRQHRYASIVLILTVTILVTTSFTTFYALNKTKEALKLSDAKQIIFKEDILKTRTFSYQMAFAVFMTLWKEDKIDKASEFLPYLGNSLEAHAARYLLSDIDLEEFKKAALNKNPAFGYYVIGEVFEKRGSTDQALELYQQCLAKETSSDLDDWYINQAKRNIELLSSHK